MFWPQLIGRIEVEERRPRYWKEPRRKRLNFVKQRTGGSDDWALVTASNGRHYYESEQQLWDRRQREAQQRFAAEEEFRWQQQQARDRQRFMLHHQVPHQPLEGFHGDPRIQQLPPPPPHDHGIEHPGHHPGDGQPGIVEVPSDSEGSDGDHKQKRSPLLIEIAPREKLPKEFRLRRSKSRGRGRKKQYPASLLSDDSSSEDEVFRVVSKGSLSRRPVARRGRSRSRVFELSDDSFEDLELHRPARSKSRGSRHGRRR
ncbi:hypothetical protein ACLMJK_008342 [Lecanora helva]